MPRVRYCMVETGDCPRLPVAGCRLPVAGCLWERNVRGTRLGNMGPQISGLVSLRIVRAVEARCTVEVAKF
jgi:hypothetical protein